MPRAILAARPRRLTAEKSTRRRFTREFKLEAVRQVREEERLLKHVAEELGLNAAVLGRWVKESRSDPAQSFPGNGKLKPADEENRLLRLEVKRLREERDILKKATLFFAKEGQK